MVSVRATRFCCGSHFHRLEKCQLVGGKISDAGSDKFDVMAWDAGSLQQPDISPYLVTSGGGSVRWRLFLAPLFFVGLSFWCKPPFRWLQEIKHLPPSLVLEEAESEKWLEVGSQQEVQRSPSSPLSVSPWWRLGCLQWC